MHASQDEVLIHFDSARDVLVVYRLKLDQVGAVVGKVLHTEYPMSKLEPMAFDAAGRLIGEDVLMALKATRERLVK